MYTIAMRAKTYKQDDLHRFQKKDSVGQRPVIDERESICCRGYAGHEVYGNNSTGAGLYGDTLEVCFPFDVSWNRNREIDSGGRGSPTHHDSFHGGVHSQNVGRYIYRECAGSGCRV